MELNAASLKRLHLVNFGGLRDEVLKRDNYCCVFCGMTDEEHRLRWNCSITVDHKDGGFNNKNKRHSLDNLQTLCRICHGKKDGVRRFCNKNYYTVKGSTLGEAL